MSQAYFQDHFQEYFILLYVALTAYLTVVFSESNGALIWVFVNDTLLLLSHTRRIW